MEKNILEDLRYIRATLVQISYKFENADLDDIDNMAAQDIFAQIDSDIETLMDICEEYTDNDYANDFSKKITDYQANHQRTPFA